MNKAILFLFNVFVVFFSYSSEKSSQFPAIKSQCKLPISPSDAELNRSNSKFLKSDNQTPIEYIFVNSLYATPDPDEKFTPDTDLFFVNLRSKIGQVFYENKKNIENDSFVMQQNAIRDLEVHAKMLYSNFLFQKINYQNLSSIIKELQKYEAQKRVSYGSMIIDKQNQSILEDEHKKIVELRMTQGCALIYGSRSRLEQRQQYLQEREEFLQQLLEQYS